jgi:hypothetical protein
MSLLRWEPEVAVAKFDAGELLYFPIESVAEMVGMASWEELRPWLENGDLQAFIMEKRGDHVRLALRSDHVVEWMARNGFHRKKKRGAARKAPRAR